MIVSFCKKFILNDQKRIRKSGFLMCSVFALFVIVNACTYVVFLHKTYPNTMVNTYSIGSTAYGSIATKTSHLPLLRIQLPLLRLSSVHMLTYSL
jgi:hypothetical protein